MCAWGYDEVHDTYQSGCDNTEYAININIILIRIIRNTGAPPLWESNNTVKYSDTRPATAHYTAYPLRSARRLPHSTLHQIRAYFFCICSSSFEEPLAPPTCLNLVTRELSTSTSSVRERRRLLRRSQHRRRPSPPTARADQPRRPWVLSGGGVTTTCTW